MTVDALSGQVVQRITIVFVFIVIFRFLRNGNAATDILMMKLFKLSKCVWGWFLALRFYSGLACTHARALIKENLTTAHVSVPFIPSPKSMKPIQGGDFFRHEPPPLPFRLLSLQPCV